MSVLSQTNSIKRTSISSDCYKPDLENQASLFRLKKIQIQRSNAIDQIRLHYDDGKTSQIGHDGGKYDVREVVFAKDEYLLKVEHESFLNFRIAGKKMFLFLFCSLFFILIFLQHHHRSRGDILHKLWSSILLSASNLQ